MREYKFRAWDTEENKMIYYEPLTHGCHYKELCACYIDNTQKFWIDDHFSKDNKLILMEYIGLYNKDGVEIYEGDIVTLSNEYYARSNETALGVIQYMRDEPGFEISIDYGKLLHKNEYRWYDNEINFSWNHLVVLGNIYENPELLE